jgi:hypothetical protein
MTLTSLARPSYMPKYKPDASCVLYLEGQQDPQSATIRDLSGKANHGTITGATWVRLPSGLWVNNFDGTDDIITVTNSVSNNIIGDITLMAWVNITADESGGIIDKNYLVGGYMLWVESVASGFASYILGVHQGSSLGAITLGKWYFLAQTVTATAGMLYQNAVAQNGGVGGNPTGNANDVLIGSEVSANRRPNMLGWGFRVFNLAFSATQIAGIFNQERSLFGV